MTIIHDLKASLAELGQGGIEKLHAVETSLNALGELLPETGPECDAYAALRTSVLDLHGFGAMAYRRLGLKMRSPANFTGANGEVQLLSGGTDDKDGTP